MRACITVRSVLCGIVIFWGCSEDASVPGSLDAAVPDAAAPDAAVPDAAPDAGVGSVIDLTCAAARDDAGNAMPIRVEIPGRWQMEACDVDVVFEFDLAFGQSATVALSPGTGFTSARGISAAGDDLGQFAGGDGEYALSPTAAETRRVQLQVHRSDDVGFELEVRPVECAGQAGCDAGDYCAPGAWICVDCEDGDDLFDGGGDRGDGAPTPIDVNAAVDGFLCADDEDWYVMALAAGEAVELVGAGQATAFEADDAAQSLGDLVWAPERPLGPLEDRQAWQDVRDEIREFIRGQDLNDLSGRWISARSRARTIWVRVDPTLRAQPYRFEPVGGPGACDDDVHCVPGTYCGAEQTCLPCAFGPDQDDDLHLSADAVPTPLTAGESVAGAVCGADIDWYALTIDQPAGSPTFTTVQVESEGPVGLHLIDPGVTPVESRAIGEGDQRLPLRGIEGSGVFLLAVVGAPGSGTAYTVSAIREAY